MTPTAPPAAALPGPVRATLATADILTIEFPPEAADGTYLYCYRLAGICRRVAAVEGRLGPILRLQGEFLAARAGATWAARSLIAPEGVVGAVRAAFAEHPRASTRDRVRVHLDFDLWAVRQAAAPLGYVMHAEGRAWVPHPLSALLAQALARPYPQAPELN